MYYIYNRRRGEFLMSAQRNNGTRRRVPEGEHYLRWTPSRRLAAHWKQHSAANRRAAMINAQLRRQYWRAAEAGGPRPVLFVSECEVADEARALDIERAARELGRQTPRA